MDRSRYPPALGDSGDCGSGWLDMRPAPMDEPEILDSFRGALHARGTGRIVDAPLAEADRMRERLALAEDRGNA